VSGVKVFCLGVHSDYRCAHSGVCCSSRWEIPVPPAVETAIRSALASGRLQVEARGVPLFRSRRELPGGARVVLGLDAGGRCVFFEPGSRLCAVHGQAGASVLPPSCRQFPRVALLTPVGVFVTLSHYCPTAAAMLFRGESSPGIVADPPAFPAAEPWEGLDARGAWPPLLRPGVLLGWDGFLRFQEDGVALLLREDLSAEAACALLSRRAEQAASWTARDGSLLDRLAALVGELDADAPEFRFERALATWSTIVARVPASLGGATPALAAGAEPAGVAATHARLVLPAWPAWAGAVRRYLAARFFASWTALQGDGLLAWARAAGEALEVLHVEAARGCGAGGVPLDAALLREAVRRSDLLLVHLARPA